MPTRILRVVGVLLGFSVAGLLILPAEGQTCASQTFSNNKLFQHCSDLSSLSSPLHWTYDASGSLAVAFVAPPAASEGWISWAINPTGSGMVGAQSLIAFKQDGFMTVKPYRLNSYQSVEQRDLTLEVSDMSAESSGGQMMIFATFRLPANWTTVNQVWQVGSAVSSDGRVGIHDFQSANLNARGTLDLVGGQTGVSTGGDSRIRKRNIHGVLNAASWGFLFPVGIMIARYLRTFKCADPAWFYLHVGCQIPAYAIGAAGLATGLLQLGSKSKGTQYTWHRYLGIALLSLATLQIFGSFLRPNKGAKFRFFWNIFHHGVGYSILIVSIINVFKGLDILQPAKKWKLSYILVIVVLGGIMLFLEAITWIVVSRRRSSRSTYSYNASESSNMSI